jgi:hypothetical protein
VGVVAKRCNEVRQMGASRRNCEKAKQKLEEREKEIERERKTPSRCDSSCAFNGHKCFKQNCMTLYSTLH